MRRHVRVVRATSKKFNIMNTRFQKKTGRICTGVARILVWEEGHPADATQPCISRLKLSRVAGDLLAPQQSAESE